MSSEDVLLKSDTHYCKNWLAGCRRWKLSTSYSLVQLLPKVLPGGDQIATLVTMVAWRRLSINE